MIALKIKNRMVNLPILKNLNVTGYALYPGKEHDGLSINFIPGLTLILGSNGLGKTTLITIIYRLLTGPFEIPRLNSNKELGTAELESIQLKPQFRTLFAQRVMDNAVEAKAKLVLSLGETQVIIERNLKDMSLSMLAIDGEVLPNNENSFQSTITSLSDVNNFGDWILVLRYLVFYFEDRRALVWDSSAQWQVLRRLFLSHATAKKLDIDERAILELDSLMRNTRALVTRQERTYAENEAKTNKGEVVIKALATLRIEQDAERKELTLLEATYYDWDTARDAARLRLLKARQERESKYRFAEKIKLESIKRTFPSLSETNTYILSQIIIDNQCLVCGSNSPLAAETYIERVNHGNCIVCGSTINVSANSSVSLHIYEEAISKLQKAEEEVAIATTELSDVDSVHKRGRIRIAELNLSINKRSSEIDKLVRQLPPEEAVINEQRNSLIRARNEVNDMIKSLEYMRSDYGSLVAEVSKTLVLSAEKVQLAFSKYAKGFLLEESSLAWSPKKARIGQEGIQISYPAFEIEMTGTNFSSSVRRSGPEQVSESQREFIDLAFRMALIETADKSKSGTLIIDAPESSLDAVFVTRAADVLSKFAEPTNNNRLVITSNLIEGKLIPSLLRQAKEKDNVSHLFDLFEVAEPTAATRELKTEYDNFKKILLK
jgi:energy-coupling factor transporter ATP-binding protein EcfA2